MKRRTFAFVLFLALMLTLAAPAGAKNLGLSDAQSVVSVSPSTVIMEDGSLLTWGGFQYDEEKHCIISSIKLIDNARSVAPCYGDLAVITTDNELWQIQMHNIDPTTEAARKKLADNVLSFQGDSFNTYLTTDHKLMYINDNGDSVFVTDDVVSAAVVAHGFYGSGFAVVRSDGSLWMSGIGYYGDGNEPNEANTSYGSFTKVMDDALSVNSCEDSFAVIKKDHSLWTWGWNSAGQLGTGTKEKSLFPVRILEDVESVYCSNNNKMWGALKTDGSLWLWGTGRCISMIVREEGDLQESENDPAPWTPTKVMDGVAAFSFNSSYALVVRTDGSLWGWGFAYSPPGDYEGDLIYQSVPIKLMDGVMLPGGSPVPAPVADAVGVTVNGVPVEWTDAQPFINADSRTMVPLRAVGDALGLTVTWDAAAREAVFTDGNKTLRFPIGSTIAYTGEGEALPMDTAAVIVGDRTYAPARYLAEYFGCTVGWDGAARTVVIEKPA